MSSAEKVDPGVHVANAHRSPILAGSIEITDQ